MCADRCQCRFGSASMADWLGERRVEAAADRILDAAETLFTRHGAANVAMNDVATAAGCSRATLYRYFENRDALHTAYAPVATASRGTRVKVWSFYLTFLNSVVELGAEEGKHAFGSARWKQLVSRCRDGSVWDDVVRDGYAGVEGDVDADVVVNL